MVPTYGIPIRMDSQVDFPETTKPKDGTSGKEPRRWVYSRTNVRYVTSFIHLVVLLDNPGIYVALVDPNQILIWSYDPVDVDDLQGSMVENVEPIDVAANVMATEKEEGIVPSVGIDPIFAFPPTTFWDSQRILEDEPEEKNIY